MTKARRFRASLLALGLACALGALPARVSVASEAGWQVGSAFSSVVYAPLKLFYATAGLVFGGLGWGLSGGDRDIAAAVITPAVRGDYLVTPAHLRGERRLEFVGSAAGEPDPAPLDPGEPGDLYGDTYYGY